jgi:acyl-CoA reductase-like NAD-dependent aldehyde dehydrogenase
MALRSAQTIQSINPANKQSIGDVPLMSAEQVQEAVADSQRAFEGWQLTNYAERAQKLLDFRKVIQKRADEIAALITREMGKPIVESYLAELNGPLDSCVYLAENAEKILKDQSIQFTNPLMSSKQGIITFEPLGVIGIIAPWNYPFSIPTMTILSAVMTGNTVVLKPSEKSSLVGLKISELFEEAGFPKGVVTVVTGDGRTGEALTKCRLAKIIFTGSVEGGVKVMTQAAPNLIPVCLELGGKDAAIVLQDAPPDFTARGLVWGAFTNAGQACASFERIYIVKGKSTDKLLERIHHYTQLLRVGQPEDQSTEIGPVVDESQLVKIVAQVEQAKSMGAHVICGGKRRDDLGGYFFEPTVITGVNHTMDVMTKETFGPVMPIMLVESEDDAVALANDSQYGLTASVWTSDLTRAEAVARDLNVGTVFFNDGLFSHASPQAPWGGLKQSGFGRSHSHFGLIDLVNIKHICKDSPASSSRFWWYPYGPTRAKTVQGGIKYLHGATLGTKISGLIDFLGGLLKKSD